MAINRLPKQSHGNIFNIFRVNSIVIWVSVLSSSALDFYPSRTKHWSDPGPEYFSAEVLVLITSLFHWQIFILVIKKKTFQGLQLANPQTIRIFKLNLKFLHKIKSWPYWKNSYDPDRPRQTLAGQGWAGPGHFCQNLDNGRWINFSATLLRYSISFT